MIIVDGMELDPIMIVIPALNPKFDPEQPESDENQKIVHRQMQGIAITCEIHGNGGVVQFAIPKKAGKALRKALREFDGVDIVEARADQMPKGPLPGDNGAAS